MLANVLRENTKWQGGILKTGLILITIIDDLVVGAEK